MHQHHYLESRLFWDKRDKAYQLANQMTQLVYNFNLTCDWDTRSFVR